MAALKAVIVKPRSTHTGTVIFNHGLGDTGHGWTFLAEQLAPAFPGVKWLFPHAPQRPITLNMGMKMPAWFDIHTLRAPLPGDPRGQEDEKGMLASVAQVEALVDEEIRSTGIAAERIVVGGFSQGAGLSLLLAITTEKKLAGVAALSGWLPLDHKAPSLRKPGTKDTQIFMGHGRQDPVVQFPWGEASYKFLQEKLEMPNVEFKAYNGLQHSANEDELRDFATWLKKVLPESSGSESSKI